MIPVVVLDTNVIIAGLRSSAGASFALLRALDTGYFVPGLTAALVLEYESVCLRSLDELEMTAADVRILLDYLCGVGRRAEVRFRVRPTVPDPGDELVLEAAIAAGGRLIVTHNVRDLAAGAARHGVDVARPGEALVRLGVPG